MDNEQLPIDLEGIEAPENELSSPELGKSVEELSRNAHIVFSVDKYFNIEYAAVTLRNPVTFIVGRNSTGKSTLLEAIEKLGSDNNLHRAGAFFDKWALENHRSKLGFKFTKASGEELVYISQGKEGIIRTPLMYEIEYPSQLEQNNYPTEKPSKNTLPGGYGSDKWRKSLLETVLIRAERDAELKLSPDAHRLWGKFIRTALNEIDPKDRKPVEQAIETIDKNLSRLMDESTITVRDTLMMLDDFKGASIELTKEPRLEELAEELKLVFHRDDAQEGSRILAEKMGTGAKALALLSIFLTYLVKSAFMNRVVLLIDEPELYLHPHAIRVLNELMLRQRESSLPPSIVAVTHSPVLIKGAKPSSIVRMGRINNLNCSFTIPTHLYNDIDAAFPDGIPESAVDGVFARGVVLVEGAPDRIVFYELGHLIRTNDDHNVLNDEEGVRGTAATLRKPQNIWDYSNLSVIPVGGKNSFQKYAKLYLALGIPVYVIGDADAATQLKSLNKALLGNGYKSIAVGVHSFHLWKGELLKGELEDCYDLEALARRLGVENASTCKDRQCSPTGRLNEEGIAKLLNDNKGKIISCLKNSEGIKQHEVRSMMAELTIKGDKLSNKHVIEKQWDRNVLHAAHEMVREWVEQGSCELLRVANNAVAFLNEAVKKVPKRIP